MTTSKVAPEELTRLRNAFARLVLQWMAAPSTPGPSQVFAPPFSSMDIGDWRQAVRLWLAHRSVLLRDRPARQCPGCGSGASRWLFESYDGYPYHECLSCGCWFVPITIDGAIFDALFEVSPEAGALAARMMTGRDDDTRRAADMARIGHYLGVLGSLLGRKGLRYLDVGCGVGHSLRAGRERGMDVRGIEVDETARALATADGLPVVDNAADLGSSQYDLISFWETLEHIADPLDALERVVPLMAADGVVSITVPNLNAPAVRIMREACAWVHGGYNTPGHINLFNSDVLARLLERAGLRVFHVEGRYATAWQEIAAYMAGSSHGAFDALGLQHSLHPGLSEDLVDTLNAVAPGIELVERVAGWSPIVWVSACRTDRMDAFAAAAAARRDAQRAELSAAARGLIATEPDYKEIAEDMKRHLLEVQRRYHCTLVGRLDRWRSEGKFSFLGPMKDWFGRTRE